jgi:hypothetical protein
MRTHQWTKVRILMASISLREEKLTTEAENLQRGMKVSKNCYGEMQRGVNKECMA